MKVWGDRGQETSFTITTFLVGIYVLFTSLFSVQFRLPSPLARTLIYFAAILLFPSMLYYVKTHCIAQSITEFQRKEMFQILFG